MTQVTDNLPHGSVPRYLRRDSILSRNCLVATVKTIKLSSLDTKYLACVEIPALLLCV